MKNQLILHFYLSTLFCSIPGNKVALAGVKPIIVTSGSIVNLEFEILRPQSANAGSPLKISELTSNGVNVSNNFQASEFTMGSPVVPEEYALSQNYPNPFNAQTVIKYQLPKPGRVVLKIFNTLGQEVKTLIDEEKEAGYYEIH